jgi:nucleoside-diphosphate-sugar epimerase
MRVFVTGANGFVGSAIIEDLIGAGHAVPGLARSDGAGDVVNRMGAERHRGDRQDTQRPRSSDISSEGRRALWLPHVLRKFGFSVLKCAHQGMRWNGIRYIQA